MLPASDAFFFRPSNFNLCFLFCLAGFSLILTLKHFAMNHLRPSWCLICTPGNDRPANAARFGTNGAAYGLGFQLRASITMTTLSHPVFRQPVENGKTAVVNSLASINQGKASQVNFINACLDAQHNNNSELVN